MDRKNAIITDIEIETGYNGNFYRCLIGMLDVNYYNKNYSLIEVKKEIK
jgi:hypothetical protein